MQFKIMKLNSKFFYVALASMAMAGCGDDWNEISWMVSVNSL